MNQPLVSIITVVYNNMEGIQATINSVLNQPYETIEYIIIDGGSTDGTREIIEQNKSGISNYISEPDQGIYDAMNKGIKLATGDLIGIINSGDYLEADAVENVVKAYTADSAADVYHGILRIFSGSGHFMQVIGNDSSFLSTGMIEHPTCFVKRSAYEKFGHFDLRYKSSADYDFMLRLWEQKARFHFIESILANFFMGGMSSQSAAVLETIQIRYQHGLISSMKKRFLRVLTKLRFAKKI